LAVEGHTNVRELQEANFPKRNRSAMSTETAVDDWLRDDELTCPDCDMAWDECECNLGNNCGRWRNGLLVDSCMKAGSEECDFECPLHNAPSTASEK
jgi:hypothetical protein